MSPSGSQRPTPAAGKWVPAPTPAPSPFLRKGSQPEGSEDMDTIPAPSQPLHGVAAVQDMGSGGRIDLREAGEMTKPKPAPWLFACPAIHGHSMESALSHQSSQMLQDASHNRLSKVTFPQPAKQPAPCSHEMSCQHLTCPHGVPSGHTI